MKKIEKVQKLVSSTNGQSAPKKEAEPKVYEKTYKLTKVNQELCKKYLMDEEPFDCSDIEIFNDNDGWAVMAEDFVLGYLPVSAATYMNAHQDDMAMQPELDEEGLHLTFEY